MAMILCTYSFSAIQIEFWLKIESLTKQARNLVKIWCSQAPACGFLASCNEDKNDSCCVYNSVAVKL